MSNKMIIRETIIFFSFLSLITMGYVGFYNYIYSTIDIKLKDNKSIKYNSKDYDLEKFVLNSNGKIKRIVSDVDSSVIGKQEVVVEVSKYNITKNLSFYVDVIDDVAPTIKLNSENINITLGDNYNLLDNISSVVDDVDGNLEFIESNKVNEKSKKYYTINGEFNNNGAGTYNLVVKAVDSSLNETSSNFTINVEKPKIVFKKIQYGDASPSSKESSISQVAESLVGSPYVSGGNDLSGFDCSGFVQYVYAQNGLSISRTSSSQVNDGVGVGYEYARPGDILIWGYSNGVVTHSAIYIGNDLMIHAANPNTGVIRSSVSGWTRGSNVEVLYVRRLLT